MTENDIDGIVFPQDEGTGLSDTVLPDWTSGGHFGALTGRGNASDFVEEGLGLTLGTDDSGNPTLDAAAGLAFIEHGAGVTVQDSDGDYTRSWDAKIALPVHAKASAGLPLTDGDVNHIFLGIDLTQNNRVYYEINTTGAAPADPHLKVGLVDTTEGTVHETNRSGPQSDHAVRTSSYVVERGEEFIIPAGQGEVATGPLTGEGRITGEGRLKVV